MPGLMALRFEAEGLAPDTFEVRAFRSFQAISRPYRFEIDLDSTDGDVVAADVVGKKGLFMADLINTNGLVAQFEYVGFAALKHHYRAVLVPHLWLLSLRYDNELYLEMTLPEVMKRVMDDAGLTYKVSLSGSYGKKEIITQYQETDLDFILRITEHRGVCFRFDQEGSKDEVEFFDKSTDAPPVRGEAKLRYEPDETVGGTEPTVAGFAESHRLVAAKVLVKDYNYRTPETALLAEETVAEGVDGSHYFEYGSHHADQSEGEAMARVRMEEIESTRRIFHGRSDQSQLAPGFSFELTGHSRGAMNGKYLVTSVQEVGSERSYSNEFTCIPLAVPYRPPRRTPVPRVAGVMTAKTETSGGDYAHIDEMGRYRVRMHFDLGDAGDAEASAPIRMNQPYSGPGYGIHFPNHANTEIVWACVNGDPDRPIALGSAPNPSNEAPATSENKSQNVIKTWGGHFLVFDDEKGSEVIALFSTKDHTVQITNNEQIEIGNDRSIHVKGTHDEAIDEHMNLNVQLTSTEDVGTAKTVSVGGSYSIDVGAALNVTVTGASMENVGGAKSLSVGGSVTTAVQGSSSVNVTGSSDERIGDSKSVMVTKDLDEKIQGKHMVQVTKEHKVQAKKLQLIATDEISLKTGSAQIVMKKNGNIEIKGKDITVQGSGKINVKAGSTITMKGSQIKEN
jgi:type VI secretion system secreted protein VgrG